MKTKAAIIRNMCLTYNHAYEAPVQEIFPGTFVGLSDTEKEMLYKSMKQIFENDIQPTLEQYGWKDK